MKSTPLLSLVFSLSALAFHTASFAADHPMIGESAPEFDLHSLDGERFQSGDLLGKLVVLHFGAGW